LPSLTGHNFSQEDIVQIRLLACLAGGLMGVAVASTINDTLGLSPTIAFIGCAAIGVALGYVVSQLIDVFAPSHGGKNAN
jgi:presenilin-like A22 family membrane protease